MPNNYQPIQPAYGGGYRPPYGGKLPGLTGPTNLPPISPGGTIAIDTNEDIRRDAAGYWTDADKNSALGGFGGSDSFYSGMMGNGGYDPATIGSMKSSLSGSILDQGRSAGSALNSALAQRGLG